MAVPTLTPRINSIPISTQEASSEDGDVIRLRSHCCWELLVACLLFLRVVPCASFTIPPLVPMHPGNWRACCPVECWHGYCQVSGLHRGTGGCSFGNSWRETICLHCVAQPGLKLTVFLLLPPECWHYRCVPPDQQNICQPWRACPGVWRKLPRRGADIFEAFLRPGLESCIWKKRIAPSKGFSTCGGTLIVAYFQHFGG